MASTLKRRQSPWSFVPTLYVLQGFSYFVVQAITSTFLVNLGTKTSDVGHWSSQVDWPWTLKPLWSPLVDLVGTKRRWILGAQGGVLCGLLALVLACRAQDPTLAALLAAVLVAFAAATYDIAADGFYLAALEKSEQELFVGVRNAFFRLGRIAVMSGLVWIAGELHEPLGTSGLARGASWPEAWGTSLTFGAGFYGVLLLWNAFTLPHPARDHVANAATRSAGAWAAVRVALVSYFTQPSIPAILAFIFLYRFGESMLMPMLAPFLQGQREDGGLAISNQEFAWIYGTYGVLALLAGGILGGAWISRRGLARCIWPMAIAMHVPNLLFAWLATERPGLLAVGTVLGVEQFCYGFGFAAYMAFLLQISRRTSFQTTHYAISTGLMGLSAQAAKWVSGDLAEALGWRTFFLVVAASALLGLAPLAFLPRDEQDSPQGA